MNPSNVPLPTIKWLETSSLDRIHRTIAFADEWRDFCLLQGLKRLPGVHYGENCSFIAGGDQILFNPETLSELGLSERQAVCGHELGHLLAGHLGSTPETEREADALCVQMMGSPDPLVNAIECLRQSFLREAMQIVSDAQMPRDKASSLIQSYLDRVTASHGSCEDRYFAVRAIDPTDRRQLDRLIERRNLLTSAVSSSR